MTIDTSKTIPCLVCGKRLKVLAQHLRKKHGLSTQEYCQEYNTGQLVSEAIWKQLADRMGGTFRGRHWPTQDLLNWIRRLRQHDPGLTYATLARSIPDLAKAVRKQFGSWGAALAQAEGRGGEATDFGVPATIECRICGKQMRSIAGAHLRTHGVSKAQYLRQFPGAALIAPATSFVLSRNLLERFGSPITDYQPLTRSQLLDALRERQRQMGEELTSTWLRREDLALYRQLLKHFGRYTAALKAAGLPSRTQRTWTRAKVISRIQEIHASGGSLRPVDLRKAGYDYLIQAAERRFENWAEAVRSAGIDPEVLDLVPRRWSPELVIRELREWGTNHGAVSPRKLEQTDRPLFRAACRHFGTTEAAAAAAAIEYRLDHSQRKWSAEDVITELQALAAANLRFNRTEACRAVPGLGDAASRHHGSWAGALAAAGLQKLCHYRTRTPAALRRDIGLWIETHGEVTYMKLRSSDLNLLHGLQNRYGNLDEASRALGFPYERRRRRWTKEKIIQALRDRVQPGDTRGVGCIVSSSALGQAIRRHFGNMPAALKAAGLMPGDRQ